MFLNNRQERRSCPQCGAKVGPKGSARVIPLFLHNLVATDTGELETLRSTLEEEKRLRKQVGEGRGEGRGVGAGGRVFLAFASRSQLIHYSLRQLA